MTTPSTLAARLQHLNGIALGTAVCIVMLFVLVSSFTLGWLSLIDAHRVQARVLAENAVAPLLFEDVKAADELLQSLRHSSDIETAALYGKDGQRVSAYLREQDAPVARFYEMMESTPDCMTCSAWWENGASAYLKRYHYPQFKIVQARLDVINQAVGEHIAHFNKEVQS